MRKKLAVHNLDLSSNSNTPPTPSKQRLNIVNKKVQVFLRQAVDRLGWSDSEVARYSGHPQSTIYRLLNAKTSTPPFGLVYDVCQILGAALPYSEGKEHITAPITHYLALSSSEADKQNNDVEYIHILPELKSLTVGKVVDDCADRRYPKGSLLFISQDNKQLMKLKANDVVIVRISNSKQKTRFTVPMIVITSPNDDEWILHCMSTNKNKQHIYTVEKETLSNRLSKNKIQVIGKVQKALI